MTPTPTELTEKLIAEIQDDLTAITHRYREISNIFNARRMENPKDQNAIRIVNFISIFIRYCDLTQTELKYSKTKNKDPRHATPNP